MGEHLSPPGSCSAISTHPLFQEIFAIGKVPAVCASVRADTINTRRK